MRYLHFGSEWVQGAMRIARPYALELEYTREMMVCLLLKPDGDWPQRILQIGLGAASLTKFWHRHRPDASQTIIEINPGVVSMAAQAFKLPDDPARIDIRIADGVAWMAETRRDKFDCIMVDGYDHHARFGELGTESFYTHCRRHLSKRGLLVLNLFGRGRGYRQQIDNLDRAFDGRVLALPPVEGGNAIAIAAQGERVPLDMPTLRVQATALQQEAGLKLAPALPRLERAIAGRVAL